MQASEHDPTASSAPLPAGTSLRGYTIVDCVAADAYGFLYRAGLEGMPRLLEEYLPQGIAVRADGGVVPADSGREAHARGVRSFLEEASILGGIDVPALVRVETAWGSLGAAYRVMPPRSGRTLGQALGDLGHVPDEAEIMAWLDPVLDAVAALHDVGVVHGGIDGDRVLLTDAGPLLLAPGAARRAVASVLGTPQSALSAGHAAIEQYGPSYGVVGPWTDIHALGALVYAAITGAPPDPAPERRVRDRTLPVRAAAAGLYRDPFLAAIDAAIAVDAGMRPSDVATLRAALAGSAAMPLAGEPVPAALADPMLEPFGPAAAASAGLPPRPGTPDTAPRDVAPEPPASAVGGSRAREERTGATPTAPVAAASLARTSASAAPKRESGAKANRRALALVGVSAAFAVAVSVSLWTGRGVGPDGAPDASPSPSAGRGAGRAGPRDPTAPTAAPSEQTLPGTATLPATEPGQAPPRTANARADAQQDGSTGPAATGQPGATLGATPASAGGVVPPAATTPATPVAPPSPRPTAAAAAPPPGAMAGTAPAPAAASDPLRATARQARCIEILQEASIAPMNPADAEFYKRACKP